jgi:CDP-2,3-bis-(O-geranylgeranyl)-sn-glycerol synthase
MTISTESAEVEKKKHIRIALILTGIFACLLIIDFLTISLIYSWSDWIVTLIFSLLFIVPAYISNAGMVIVGGGEPIDRGKLWRDGKRILGDHKTWSGLIKGPLFIGIPISLVIFCIFILLWPIIQLVPSEGIQLGLYKIYDNLIFYEYYFIGGPFPNGIGSLIVRIVLCSYGAGLGDLMGSFLKRRFNFKSGAPFWIVDQLDFIVIAMVMTSIPSLFFPTLYWSPDINIIIFLLILTPSVSIFANSIAYIIGLKEVPW